MFRCALCPNYCLPGQDLCEECDARIPYVQPVPDWQIYGYDPPGFFDGPDVPEKAWDATSSQVTSYIAYQFGDGEGELYDFIWSYDGAFPVRDIVACSQEEAQQLLDQENDGRIENGWDPTMQSGQQFYDSYRNWWKSPQVLEFGWDVPIINQTVQGEWTTWDGWHRCLIAHIAGQETIPVLKGVLKNA